MSAGLFAEGGMELRKAQVERGRILKHTQHVTEGVTSTG